MNRDALGAIGEIVGSLAVVITVAYLAVQIRQGAREARSAAINQSRAAVTDVLSGISSDTDAADIYFRGLHDLDALSAAERVRFELIIFQMLRVTETMFFEYQQGVLNEELWEAQWYGTQNALRTPGAMAFWKRRNKMLTRSFVTWVEEWLKTADGFVDP